MGLDRLDKSAYTFTPQPPPQKTKLWAKVREGSEEIKQVLNKGS